MSGPSTWDSVKDFGWNVLTGIPGVGTAASGLALVADGTDALLDSGVEPGQVAQDERNMASDAISMIPLVGTATSLAGAAYDILSPDDTWGNLTNQMMGGTDQYPGDPNS